MTVIDLTEEQRGQPTNPASDLAQLRDQVTNLEVALRSARRIGIAIGILMALRKCTEDKSFELLQRTSQQTNRKLRDIAESVILSGTLPTDSAT
jgi:AmiR/NasT family two-component response regulator